MQNLTDFEQTYDKKVFIPKRIRAALTELAVLDECRYEIQFLKMAEVSQNEIGAYRDQFSDHIVTARAPGGKPKNVWFGSVETACKARKMVK